MASPTQGPCPTADASAAGAADAPTPARARAGVICFRQRGDEDLEEAHRIAAHAQESPQQRDDSMAKPTEPRQVVGRGGRRRQIAQGPVVPVVGKPIAAALTAAAGPGAGLLACTPVVGVAVVVLPKIRSRRV